MFLWSAIRGASSTVGATFAGAPCRTSGLNRQVAACTATPDSAESSTPRQVERRQHIGSRGRR
jgi:hypothetical protein